jgi:hypothetical protein
MQRPFIGVLPFVPLGEPYGTTFCCSGLRNPAAVATALFERLFETVGPADAQHPGGSWVLLF